MTKEQFKELLIELLGVDEDVQYWVKEALEEQQRRDDHAEARAWT